jgi:hypothetical protein
MQPCSWHERPNGRLRLELRCPECLLRTTGEYELALVADYDRTLVAGRIEIGDLYRAVTRANMEAEAGRLARALELDLISADDFAGYNR